MLKTGYIQQSDFVGYLEFTWVGQVWDRFSKLKDRYFSPPYEVFGEGEDALVDGVVFPPIGDNEEVLSGGKNSAIPKEGLVDGRRSEVSRQAEGGQGAKDGTRARLLLEVGGEANELFPGCWV